MATIDDVIAAMIVFRNEVYSRFDDIDTKLESLVLHGLCAVCQGSGELSDPVNGEPGPPYTCPSCAGDGSIKVGNIDTVDEGSAYE